MFIPVILLDSTTALPHALTPDAGSSKITLGSITYLVVRFKEVAIEKLGST